ncbi:flagellar biosynthesis protein FlhF, partial [bacterium]|nr:flagellar biosynthesis protein FlhF [bacterium]
YGRDQLALLSTDTFRIGAQEQLKVYAKIIGVPVVSLRDSDDLAAKINSLKDRRVILLDTAGVSQRDTQMLEQSQLLLEGAPALKRILVMSSTTDLRTQEDVILMYQMAAES